jgi:hypothetical protein
MHTEFSWGNMGERDHLENPDLCERLIFKFIFEKLDGGMDWIYLAQR